MKAYSFNILSFCFKPHFKIMLYFFNSEHWHVRKHFERDDDFADLQIISFPTADFFQIITNKMRHSDWVVLSLYNNRNLNAVSITTEKPLRGTFSACSLDFRGFVVQYSNNWTIYRKNDAYNELFIYLFQIFQPITFAIKMFICGGTCFTCGNTYVRTSFWTFHS